MSVLFRRCLLLLIPCALAACDAGSDLGPVPFPFPIGGGGEDAGPPSQECQPNIAPDRAQEISFGQQLQFRYCPPTNILQVDYWFRVNAPVAEGDRFRVQADFARSLIDFADVRVGVLDEMGEFTPFPVAGDSPDNCLNGAGVADNENDEVCIVRATQMSGALYIQLDTISESEESELTLQVERAQ